MSTKLAIHGGEPLRTKPFPKYVTVGEEEKQALSRVIDSGVLSRYLGAWHEQFYGGPEVQALEQEWAEHFKVKHAIAVNSGTSGLNCAIGAIGLEPGDEVIVPPYTMSASATAIVIYNGIPVFADIEEDCFCIDPKSIESLITPRTKAIMAVDIFGQPYNRDAINSLAKQHELKVIEDCAQAPGALYEKDFAGTLGDIGVFSLNYHKHIHCGEGGIVCTNNDQLAERIRLIRNHAEAVVEAKGETRLDNMVGFNYRMTELEASVARCQLQKLDRLLAKRLANVTYLEQQLSQFAMLSLPKIREKATHAYYVHASKFDADQAGIDRNTFINAVRAELPVFELREKEGVKISYGYVKPLYLQPMFQQQMAFGNQGWPFKAPWYPGQVNYNKGICPVTERMHEKELVINEFIVPSMSQTDIDDVIKAFEKVWDNKDSLS